jgi:hypothetical protein
MFINDIFENEDDMFSEPRTEVGKAVRNKWWGSAAGQCVRLGIRNPQVERAIIPGIIRTMSNGNVAGGATWYNVRDWYEKFIAPNDWPELIQYVSTLKAKGPVNAALEHLIRFYATNNAQRTAEVKQLIQNKKAADAAVLFIQATKQGRRWPEMEPVIMVSPRAAMYYAAGVLDGRWPEAEPYIATDKVSWSMYSARALDTNNSTRAGRAARDAAQQEALSRLPDGHKKRIAEEDDDLFSPTTTVKFPCMVISGYRDFMDSRVVKSHLKELINDGDIKMLGRIYHEDEDIVEYYVRATDETGIYNSFNNIDRHGQFGGVIHSVWDPIKRRPVLDESDDMFASSKRVKTAQIIKRVLDEKYARYEEIYNERDPRKFVDLSDELQEIDYLRNELARGGLKAYVQGLDSVSRDMVGSIGTELACNYDIGTQDLKDEYLDESEDDMFADSKRVNAQKAIKDVLDTNYDRYMEHYNEIDQEQPGAEDMLNYYGDYLSDYDYLRSELARGGVVGFLNGLEMVQHSVIDAVDGDLAIKHKVFLSNLEDQYIDDQLEEDTDPYDDDDMFASSNRITLSRDLSEITEQLSRRYTQYADTSTDDDTAELYTNESYFLGRASTAFLTGLRAGFKELEDVEDPTTWEDLHDLCARRGVDISAIADQYDAGELSESEDDMFAPRRHKPNLRKIGTSQLRMLYQLSKSDSRPEYAAAHKLQMAAIRAELERRNTGYVPRLEEQANTPIGFRKGK